MSAAPARKSSQVATAWLAGALRDPARAGGVVAALRSAGGKHVAVLLSALSARGDKKMRLMATSALGELPKAMSGKALLDRLGRDPRMAIRAEALAHLLNLKALSAEQLTEALKIPDENVRCLASRGLVRMGQGKLAMPQLGLLSGSRDATTAAMARMSLLGLGDESQLPHLSRIVRDPKTPQSLLILLIRQAIQEKVRPAIPLAMHVAEAGASDPLRVLGYKAVVTLSPHAATVLRDAIRTSGRLVLRVHLLRVLATCKDAAPHLKLLGREAGSLGALARFELARPEAGPKAAAAAGQALRAGHPVVADYILARAKEDAAADKKKAAFYTPVLLGFVRSVDPDPKAMRAQHVRAAQAVKLLTNIGDQDTFNALGKLLRGRRSAIVKTVSAGLRWSRNPAVCDLARPMLNNAYEDLAIDAAMTLGYFGRPEAADQLLAIVRRDNRHPPAMVALACWYLLKIEGTQAQAIKELIETLR